MIETIHSFLQFLSLPDRHASVEGSKSDHLSELLKLFAFVFAMVVFIAAPLLVYVGGEDLPNKLSELSNMSFDNKVLQFLAMFGLAVIVAPLIEEIIFRFPLKYRRGALVYGGIVVGMLGTGIAMNVGMIFKTAAFVGTGVGILSYALMLYMNTGEEKLDQLSKKLFPFLFYASALVFAFAHISNYELPADRWYITPALVMPQFFLGLMLGYARIKYGLWAAIFLHALNNLLPTIALALMPEGGGM